MLHTGSWLPGHRTQLVLLQQTAHSHLPSTGQHFSATISHHLHPKEMDKPSTCPKLCSCKAGSCSPGSPELALMQLQAPPHCSAATASAAAGSAPSSAPGPLQPYSQTPVYSSPELQQEAHPACENQQEQSKQRWDIDASSHGSSCFAWQTPPAMRNRVRERGRSPALMREHLNTRHAISKGSSRWSPEPVWSC